MRAKDVVTAGAAAMVVVLLCAATHVSARPQEVEDPPTEGEEKPILFPDEDQNAAKEFEMSDTEGAQTEPNLIVLTEANQEGTEMSETNTDQTGASESIPDQISEPEASPDQSDVPQNTQTETDVMDAPTFVLDEGDMTETKPDQGEVTSKPEDDMSEVNPSESATKVSEDDMMKDEGDMSEAKPGEDEMMSEPKPDEAEEPMSDPKPDQKATSEATTSEAETSGMKPSEADMAAEATPAGKETEKEMPQDKPKETTEATDTNTNQKDQTQTQETKPGQDTQTTAKPQTTQATTEQVTTRRPTPTQETTPRPKPTQKLPRPSEKETTPRPRPKPTPRPRPSQPSGSDVKKDQQGRPSSAKPDREDVDTRQNQTSTCREPGVEYPKGITFEELREALEEARVLLIDVRQPWELRETGRLPWSYNLPLPEIEEAVGLSENAFMERYGFPKPLPEDKNVVLTCRSGRRIRVAWDLLEPYGYCDVRLYFGSYLEWKSRGGPLLPVPPPRRPF